MKHDSRESHEYPDIIQAEAKGGIIVEYIRKELVVKRELLLIDAAAQTFEDEEDYEEVVYERAGLVKL